MKWLGAVAAVFLAVALWYGVWFNADRIDDRIAARIAEYDSVRMTQVFELLGSMDSVRARNDSILLVQILRLSNNERRP